MERKKKRRTKGAGPKGADADGVADIIVHTDGGCRGNPGVGAWAAVIRRGNECVEIHGVEPETTNNRMELTAAIEALSSLDLGTKVKVVTDSVYVRDGITKWIKAWVKRGWTTSDRKPVKNRDLWMRLDELFRERDVKWSWVRGHAGHPDNERCDALVNQAMDRYLETEL